MGFPRYLTKSLIAANDAVIAASQTPGAAGDLTLVSSPVVLDTGRQVILTFAANETGHNFTIYGYENTDGTGALISEVIAGTTAGVVTSTRMYGRVTRIAISAAATGAVKAGTNTVGATPWLNADYQIKPFELDVAVVVTGTVNYSVQYTYDDFSTVVPNTGQGAVPTAFTDQILSGVTANGETTFNFPITGFRVLINSGTGSLAIKSIQAGII